MNDENSLIYKVYELLPYNIKNAEIIFDPLNNRYLYGFGNQISKSIISFGGHQNLEIDNLYLAIRTAIKHLNTKDLQCYLKILDNKENHQNHIFEIRPLVNLKSGLTVQYESNNNCVENKKIDWEIKGDITILLEVKNRIKSTFDHIEHISKILSEYEAGISPEDITKPSSPEPEFMFTKTLEKMKSRNDLMTLQGVWISSGIKEDEKKLNEYFNKLDSKIIQFAIFSGWEKEAYILVKKEKYKQTLVEYFSLTETNDFVMQY